MIIKINNKQIDINGKVKTTKRTLTKEQVLRELVNGVLEFTDNTIYSSTKKGSVKYLTTKTFESGGKTYTLKKENTEIELLDTLSNGGFVELNDDSFFQLGETGGGGGNTGNNLVRIKEFQKNYLQTAGTRTNPSADTGIATSNTLTDLLSLFFIGNYKNYIQRNKDNLEIAFLVGDRRSSIDRLEWTEYFSLNSLTTETSVLLDLKGQEYDFKVQFDNNLNLKITDDHVSQENYFGALFSISIRHKL